MFEFNFGMDSLSRYHLTEANELFATEIARIKKCCKTGGDCIVCEQREYCEWLHLAQYHVLQKLTQDANAVAEDESNAVQ